MDDSFYENDDDYDYIHAQYDEEDQEPFDDCECGGEGGCGCWDPDEDYGDPEFDIYGYDNDPGDTKSPYYRNDAGEYMYG